MRHAASLVATLRGAVLTVAVGALACGSAAAQTGADDSGTFQVSIGGRQVGTEQFSIRESGVGANSEVIATGRVELNLPTGTLELTPTLRATGFQADPVAYEVTIGGSSPRKIIGRIGDGRFSARIVSPSGEQLREYVASSGATVLDDGVAHHYYFLARRVRTGRVPIIIPRENRQVMATVTDRGEEQVNIGGTSVPLYHLVVSLTGGDERHVWVDALNRVVRVEVPNQQYEAVRTEVPR